MIKKFNTSFLFWYIAAFSRRMAKELQSVGISCTVILDAAVGFIMERVNAVMLGAEGVCENGGIINKVGKVL